MRYVVIMAGGSGTRLWPLSRKGQPKQLLRLLGAEQSLLQLAYQRVQGVVPDSHIYVCTGADYLAEVAQQLPNLPAANLLGEPVGRDSVNAVAWPTAVLARADPEAVVAMLSSDHIISPVDEFRAALQTAFLAAEADPAALVTFGVVPTSAHTGYGYLRRGERISDAVYRLTEFKEKPDRSTARSYLDSGAYWWNSGMFVWRAETLLQQLQILLPQQHKLITALAAQPDQLAQIYPQLPKISVDYAIMEPIAAGQGTAQLLAVRLPVTWHDIGSFRALAQLADTDAAGNAISGAAVVRGRDNLIINTDAQGLIAVTGVSDLVVVRTAEVTLVCPLGDSESIKDLVAEVTAAYSDQFS